MMIKTAIVVAGVSLMGAVGVTVMDAAQHRVAGLTSSQAFQNPALTALADAACHCDTAEISRLLGSGVPVNGPGKDGITPLAWALSCENAAGMEALLRGGANPNQCSRTGIPIIWNAITYDSSIYLKLLLKFGADPNTIDNKEGPVLFYALFRGLLDDHWDNYYSLIDAGGDINVPDNKIGLAEIVVSLNNPSKAIELLEKNYKYDLDGLAFSLYGNNMDKNYHEYKNLAVLAKILRDRGVNVENAKQRVIADDKVLGLINHDFSFDNIK